jgi:hypothetical protein
LAQINKSSGTWALNYIGETPTNRQPSDGARPRKNNDHDQDHHTLLAAAAAVLATVGSANAWTDRAGHWHEGPQLYGPINPGAVYAPYGAPPAYGYGPVYGGPVIIERPTDTQVAIGAGLSVLGAIIAGGR